MSKREKITARETLQIMVRTDRGSMTVWSLDQASDALDAYRAEVLAEAANALDAKVDAMRAEPRWQEGKGDTRGPGLLSAVTVLRRMADEATAPAVLARHEGAAATLADIRTTGGAA